MFMGFEFFFNSGECRLMAKQLIHRALAACLLLASALAYAPSSAGQAVSAEEGSLPERGSEYITNALTLAGILGQAHAIRVTCNGRTDQFWRVYMQEMMDLEAPTRGGLRDAMAQRFNTAFSGEAARRTWCNDEAVAAEAALAAEGRPLAESLAAHYFGRDR